MGTHDRHRFPPSEPKLRLEEVDGVVSVPLRVWLSLRLVSPVLDCVGGHAVHPTVLELYLSGQSHLVTGKYNNKKN